jgi:DNA-binding transcriptional ArsR family regulator
VATLLSEMVAKALGGRQERKRVLRFLIAANEGSSSQAIKGMFTKTYAVSHRTFSEYLTDLEDEGYIYQKANEETGQMQWWSYNGKEAKR